MKTVVLALLLCLCRQNAQASDIEIVHDGAQAVLSATHKARIESIRSLWDWLLFDNGLTGTSSVVHIVIKPTRLGSSGPLSTCKTSYYKVNSRGKTILDGQYPVTIVLNIDQGLAAWSDTLLGAVVFHEMAHCFGMDVACFMANRFEGGTLFAPNEQYTGPAALAVYRAEFDPQASFIPLDGSHFAESIGPDEVVTPGLSISRIGEVFVSNTLLAIIQENGWTVRPGFNKGLLRNLTPVRRLRDEDISSR